jgi:hypothetical protein
MNTVLNFFRTNKSATLMALCAVLCITGALAMSGCSLGGFIKHDVPKDMQPFNDGEGKVNLNDAPFVMEDYLSSVERNVRRFSESNEKAHLLMDGMRSLMTVGLEELGNSPIPGATILSGLFLGLGGLMTRKPGTAKEIAAEKMASFNKGQTVALEQARALVSEDTMRALVAAMKETAA